jgi:biopolymer transport protein ExbD
MKKVILVVSLLIGICSAALAEEPQNYAQVSLSGPGSGKTPPSRDQYITLVVDGANITYEGTVVPSHDVVPFVNGLLKEKHVSIIGIYVRTGSKYGDVIRAVDALRETTAKNISVSMVEIAPGREP